MNWLVSTSLQLRVLVVILALLLMVIGLCVAVTPPLSILLEFAPSLAKIQTEAAGLSIEVNILIAVAIENALNVTGQHKNPATSPAWAVAGFLCFKQNTDLIPVPYLRYMAKRQKEISPAVPSNHSSSGLVARESDC